MTAHLIALLALIAATATVHGQALAGPVEPRAEHAAAAAKRSMDATEKLRANKPFPYERRALRNYHDALERAERHEERAVTKAGNANRDAKRAARRATNADPARKLRQRRDERKERRKRATGRSK